MGLGHVIVLNGAPRSGKSTIANRIINIFAGPWVNIGVDAFQAATPERLRPGIGLRPGGERPDLEPFVISAYRGLYACVASLSREGVNVAVDVGHHESYSRPLGILQRSAHQLEGLPVLFVGVRCPIEAAMARRAHESPVGAPYLTATPGVPIPEPVRRWQREVHRPGIYDLEVDTDALSTEACTDAIRTRLALGPGDAFARIVAGKV